MSISAGRRAVNFLSVLLTAMLLSCEPASRKQQHTHPDIPAFVKTLCRELRQENYALEKNVISEGNSSIKRISNPDWEEELLLFREVDLNSPSLTGALEYDTLSDTPLVVHYLVTDSKLALREVTLRFAGEEPDSMEAVYSSKGVYGSEQKRLVLVTRSGYSIEAGNQPSFGKSTKLTIEGKWTR